MYVVGTFDTKSSELLYLAECVADAGVAARTVDIGIRDASLQADVPARVVAGHHPGGAAATRCVDRAKALEAMALALRRFTATQDDIAGIVGIGGSSGAAMIAPAMRSLPIGLPKLLVSPVAAGDVASYVGSSDLTLMYPVTDLAGLNRVTRRVLANAAHAIAGMAVHEHSPPGDQRPVVALTTLGLTTPCVTAVAEALGHEFECQLFPAVGAGTRSFRTVLRSNLVEGIVDITLSDVASAVVQGKFDDLDARFADIAAARVPYVASCGGLDMLIFRTDQPLPLSVEGRSVHTHTANVGLVRTSPEECSAIGRALAERLNALPGPVHVLIPEQGLSALDAPGGPFHAPEADTALFNALERNFIAGEHRRITRAPYPINDPRYAKELVAAYRLVHQ